MEVKEINETKAHHLRMVAKLGLKTPVVSCFIDSFLRIQNFRFAFFTVLTSFRRFQVCSNSCGFKGSTVPPGAADGVVFSIWGQLGKAVIAHEGP